jgi:hypothetical protein
MNFKAVANTFNPQSQRQTNTTMFATVLEIGANKMSRTNKPFQAIKIVDDTGEQHQVSIHQGNNPPLDVSKLGQRLSFNLSPYQGQNGMAYSGFWNSTATVSQQPKPQASAQQQSAPSQPKSSNDAYIVRESALKSACTLFAENKEITDLDVIDTAIKFEQYILTGEKPMEADPLDDGNPFPPQD